MERNLYQRYGIGSLLLWSVPDNQLCGAWLTFSDVVDEIRGPYTYGDKITFKEPCNPCYGMVVNAMLNASIEMDLWGLDDDYWKGQLELVHAKCGGPDKIEKDFEQQKVYNASHPREPELLKNMGTSAKIGGVWFAVLFYGCSIFIL